MIGSPVGSISYGVLAGNLDGATDRWPNIADSARIGSTLDVENNTSVWIPAHVITARFDDCFYIESSDRCAGIKVMWPVPPQADTVAGISGTVETNGPERVILASKGTLGPPQTLDPLFMAEKSLGGSYTSPTAPLGFTDATGLYNIGLLVRTSGRVTYWDPGHKFIYIDDGSLLGDGNTLGPLGACIPGVRVILPPGVTAPFVDDNAVVTGISSYDIVNSKPVRAVRVRDQNDIPVPSEDL
jgi:hypothetical protein